MLATRALSTRLSLRLAALLTLAAAALLSGCAALRTVTSEVTSFGQWPAGQPAGTYTLERLPSQQQASALQTEIEQSAHLGLQAAGFRLAAEGEPAQYTVQIGARITRFDRAPWDDPLWWHPLGLRGPGGGYAAWPGVYPPWRPWLLRTERSEYLREVGLLIRDRASGQALYEARARTDGVTAGGRDLLDAMFIAAMKDFPASHNEPHDVPILR